MLNLLVMLTTVESMVLSFFDRRILSAAILAVTLWQVANKDKANSAVKIAYTILSLSLCAFTFQVLK